MIARPVTDATLAAFECYAPNVISPLEAHRIVTACVIAFLSKISDQHDDNEGENESQHLLDPKWATSHEPNVALFVTEEGGPATAMRNLGEPATFNYFLTPRDADEP